MPCLPDTTLALLARVLRLAVVGMRRSRICMVVVAALPLPLADGGSSSSSSEQQAKGMAAQREFLSLFRDCFVAQKRGSSWVAVSVPSVGRSLLPNNRHRKCNYKHSDHQRGVKGRVWSLFCFDTVTLSRHGHAREDDVDVRMLTASPLLDADRLTER